MPSHQARRRPLPKDYQFPTGDVDWKVRPYGVQFNYTGRLTQMSDGAFAVVAQQRALDDDDGYGHAV